MISQPSTASPSITIIVYLFQYTWATDVFLSSQKELLNDPNVILHDTTKITIPRSSFRFNPCDTIARAHAAKECELRAANIRKEQLLKNLTDLDKQITALQSEVETTDAKTNP